MTITDLPFFGMLKGKMRWHESRQAVLAENVANADSAEFRPRDLVPFQIDEAARSASEKPVELVRTSARHLVGTPSPASDHATRPGERFETTPSGNSVVLEEEMMKVASNQMDFQAASTLYERGLRLIRTAVSSR